MISKEKEKKTSHGPQLLWPIRLHKYNKVFLPEKTPTPLPPPARMKKTSPHVI